MTEQIYKRKLEITSIIGQNLKASGNNEGYIQFKVNPEQTQKLTSKSLLTAEWNEAIKLYTTIEDEITIQGIDSHTNHSFGQGVLKLRGIGQGKQTIKVDLTQDGKSAGSLKVSFNLKINVDYENKTGIKGKLLVSNIRFNCNKENQNGQSQCIFSLDHTEQRTSKVNNTDNKLSWKDTIIFPYKGDQSLNIKIVNVDSDEREIGTSSTNFMMLVDKEGVFYNEQSYVYFGGNEQVGTFLATLEYRPLDIGDDAKLYDLERFMGKVKISNMSAQLNRNTSSDPNDAMDPFCKLVFHDQNGQTAAHQNGGINPKWSESFTFSLQKYYKNQLLQIDIYGKNENENEYCGRAVIELGHFLSQLGEQPNQEVEVQYQQGPAGTFNFTATSYPNDELDKYKVQKEEEEKLKKKQDEEQAQKQKQEEEEKNKKKQQEEEEQIKKKQQDEEEAKTKQKQKEEEEEEQAKKKQQENQQEQKSNEGEGQHKKEGEGEGEKKKEEESQKKNEQEEKKKEEEVNEQRKSILEKSINESKLSSKKFDYVAAKKNLKNGFGLSEFQSAHTLQTSIHSTSFPKSQRFQQSLLDKSSPPYIVLPSSFDKSTLKGSSFGCGSRGILNPTANPGPGTYDLGSNFKKGNKKGYIFGESRQHCKNSQAMKYDINRSESTKNINSGRFDFTSGLKLPNINSNQHFTNRSVPNFHYLRQSQSQATLNQ